ncbi:MAG: ThuA domain-containing protein [Pseudomonadota bacterium]
MNIVKIVGLAFLMVLLSSCKQADYATSNCDDIKSPKFNTLVFTKTSGYVHSSIGAGVKALLQMGRENQFCVYATNQDKLAFTSLDELSKYDALIFLNTSGDVLDASQKAMMTQYIQNGGGFVGVHAAADTEYKWKWYMALLGGEFKSHPAVSQATMKVVDKEHPATSFIVGDTWNKEDEWYDFEMKSDVNVLLTVDETTYKGGKMGTNHPISWYHDYDGGRSFYTGLGHTKESYVHIPFLNHLLGGIRYAANQP